MRVILSSLFDDGSIVIGLLLGGLLGFLINLNRVDLVIPFEIGAKNHPLPVGRKMDVWFQAAILMVLHIDELFRLEPALVRCKEVDPHAVFCPGHLRRIAAVAAKAFLIRRYVEMYRPFVAAHLVTCFLAISCIAGGQIESVSPRDLQIVPDRLSIWAPELMPGDFPVDGALMDLSYCFGLSIDIPDPIQQVPGAFVAKHEHVGVGCGKLDMPQPGILVMDFVQLAAFDVEGKQGMGDLCFKYPGEIISLGGEFFVNGPLLRAGPSACQFGLVGIKRRDARRKIFGENINQAGRMRVDMGGKDTIPYLVEDFPAF